MRWQDEVSEEEWRQWIKIADVHARRKVFDSSLGYAEFSGTAISKLLEQSKRPANVEAWLRRVISNQYVDWLRRDEVRGGMAIHLGDESDWETEMLTKAVGSPSHLVYLRESVSEVLEVLTEDEQEILLLKTRGFDNHEIAAQLGYKSNKIVATRLGQIKKKVLENINPSDESPS